MRAREEVVVNVLVVDDRPSNLSSLHAVLRKSGYNLFLARSGNEAIAHLLRQEFAVILLDVAVPGMDGFELASLIKERDKSRRVPIIFMTASVYEMDRVFRMYEEGPVDYLRKPVDAHQVRHRVAVFAELFRLRKRTERRPISSRLLGAGEGPRSAAAACVLPEEERANDSETSVKILLVDDRAANLVSLGAVLAGADYQLTMARSGEDALKLALRTDFAAILLDVVMPGLDGFDVVAYLKLVERTSRIPVLLLTAVATDMAQICRAYSAGAVDYLIEPLDPEAVRKKVAVFAELHRQRLELQRRVHLLQEEDDASVAVV